MRLDIFVSQEKNISRSQALKYIREGKVLVNGEVQKKTGHSVTPADNIFIETTLNTTESVVKHDISFEILAETDDYIVINKPKGILTHSASSSSCPDAVSVLLHQNIPLSYPHSSRPGVVHRLDKDTTGVLIFAKTENFHQHLANQIQERTVEKWYEAFVVGNPQDGEIQGNIGRSSVNKTKQSIMSSGKESVTRFYNEQYFPRFNISKLRIHLLTGRMHQIRVHLSALGFPVLGDTVYGNEEWNQKFQLSSQCLHAKEYSFFNLQKKKITITAPLPEYFTLLLSSFV